MITPLQLVGIHCSSALTVPSYHFLFSRCLDLTERHFLSDILVPFPDSRDLYSRELQYNNKRILENELYLMKLFLANLGETKILIFFIP